MRRLRMFQMHSCQTDPRICLQWIGMQSKGLRKLERVLQLRLGSIDIAGLRPAQT